MERDSIKYTFTGNSELKHIKQQGPTCGLYAIAMIINAIRKGFNLNEIDGQALALDIFNLATDTNISNIGEVFTEKSIKNLLLEINNLPIKIMLTHSICDFNSPEELERKLQEGFNNNKYCLFPYYRDYGLNKRGAKILHWGALSHYENGYIIGQQGNSKSGKRFYKGIRNKTVIKATAEDLYNSNKSIDDYFNWKKYFSLENRINIRIDYAISMVNKELTNKVLDLTKKRIKKLKKESTFIDLKGKMILIEGTIK